MTFRNNLIPTLRCMMILMGILSSETRGDDSSNDMVLVQNGIATATLVVPQKMNRLQKEAVDDFVLTIEKSTKDIFFLKYWGLIGDEYKMSSGQ